MEDPERKRKFLGLGFLLFFPPLEFIFLLFWQDKSPPYPPPPERQSGSKEQQTQGKRNSSCNKRDRGRSGTDFLEEQKGSSVLQTRKKQSSSPHCCIPSQQSLPKNVTDWREPSHHLISIQQHHHSTWGTEAMNREKARHISALRVPSAALASSPPWHAQDAGRWARGSWGHGQHT